MADRYPKKTFQDVLNLKRENFGKVCQSFSEVHRVRDLIELGNSVCRVDKNDLAAGTGFVLFHNFILTNAHLFLSNGKLERSLVNVSVVFNFETPNSQRRVKVKGNFIDFYYDTDVKKRVLDYAILELESRTKEFESTTTCIETLSGSPSQTTEKTTQTETLSGLLSKWGPVPKTGEACLIGHPDGGVKRMDFTCIIEEEERHKAVNKHKAENMFMVFTINAALKTQEISNLLPGGGKQGDVSTYNTFFYYGASGSPVFDGSGRVFGLHTAGIVYPL
ncbi:serine protease FAM111A-like [Aplochiton taeniatus]